jgi:hypothetical protein
MYKNHDKKKKRRLHKPKYVETRILVFTPSPRPPQNEIFHESPWKERMYVLITASKRED